MKTCVLSPKAEEINAFGSGDEDLFKVSTSSLFPAGTQNSFMGFVLV